MKHLKVYLPEAISLLSGFAACFYIASNLFDRPFLWMLLVMYLAVIVSAIFYYLTKRQTMWRDLGLKAIGAVLAEIVFTVQVFAVAQRMGFWPMTLWTLAGLFFIALTLPVHLIYSRRLKPKDESQESEQP